MKATQPSATADLCAMARAHHALFDADPVFRDEVGVKLTSDRWRRVLESPVLRRVVIDGLLRPARPSTASLVGRARYLERHVETALARGVAQYVIVGAGMDSFTVRRPDLVDRMLTFEIDHPNTQRVKLARLAKHQARPPGVTFVPVDLAARSIASALADTPFDPALKTLFSWMGVTYYLPKHTVYRSLESMVSVARQGCEIIFDYQAPTEPGQSNHELPRKFVRALTRSVGEPQISAFHDDRLQTELAARGLETVEVFTGEQMRKRYFLGRPDGLRPHGHVRIAHVRSMQQAGSNAD
ncbi:MAG: class I SAM-dependent methyltransferase [Myxococcota bacterium]